MQLGEFEREQVVMHETRRLVIITEKLKLAILMKGLCLVKT
jgi:hypothetical protein